MAKSKIGKEDVAKAMSDLKRDGKNPTISALRAAMGNQGSLTTIQQLKKELRDEEFASKDSPEALTAFRKVWETALQDGRSQRDVEIQDLKETVGAFSEEVEKLEGESTALRVASREFNERYNEMLRRLTEMSIELSSAKAHSEINVSKLLDALEQHQQHEQSLRDQLSLATLRVHELEIKLARVETRLESANEQK